MEIEEELILNGLSEEQKKNSHIGLKDNPCHSRTRNWKNRDTHSTNPILNSLQKD